MKKQLLLGSALLAAISVFPQAQRSVRPAGIKNMANALASKFTMDEAAASNSVAKPIMGPSQSLDNSMSESAVAMPPSTINWRLFAGSNNIIGALVSQSRPLQYNPTLNALSFVYRKTLSYQPIPAIVATATSGVILADVSTDWGNTWDSTCLWSDATNWGRYPQGALYNPTAGNTDIANAYIVGSGPTVAGSTFSGDWYASKKLSAIGSTVGFNQTASTAPGAQQFLSLQSATYAATQGQHGWSRIGFTSTDGGAVRSLALIENDLQALSTMRGVMVVKGTFNAGTFTWTTDSLVPNTVVKSTGEKVLSPTSQMAWNAAGTVGYVAVLGADATATGSNKGYQPIIYKTTNSGTTWTQIAGINFNSPALSPLLDHISATSANPTLAIPYFSSDFDMTVDANDKLHLASTFISGASPHNDSLNYIAQYTLSVENGVNKYNWPHRPGARPYLYDFIGDGTSAWTAITVDSMSSEAVGVVSGDDGFNENPWAPTGSGSSKTCDMDSRIQVGHTPDGQYITFSWAESDTLLTNNSYKYNVLPNIKTRLMAIGSGTNMYKVAGTEINVTKLAPGTGTVNPNVANRATLHYMSPITGSATVTNGTSGFPLVDVNTPLVVTNSNPYDPIVNNTTWFQGGKLSYDFNNLKVGIKENAANSVSQSVLYPNPASGTAVLAIDLKDNSTVEVAVLNTIGQVVKSSKAQGQIGANNLNIDLNGLSTGIYLVNVKVGTLTSTKKLVVK